MYLGQIIAQIVEKGETKDMYKNFCYDLDI